MVQSPDEALFKEMPQNAIDHDGRIDFVGPVDALAAEICRAVHAAPNGISSTDDDGASEVRPAS
jgi:chemotaxis response regulator CheB